MANEKIERSPDGTLTVFITSTFTQPIVLCYRMPSGPGEPKNPVLEINLRARELNYPMAFPSEKYFEEFKRQNKHLISSSKILLGSSTPSQAQTLNKEHAAQEGKAVKKKVEKAVEELSENSGGKVKVEVQKED